jgi:GMP synthase-like glutamine amidotransferase
MRITCLQHVPFEGPAHIESWAAERGHDLQVVSVSDRSLPPLEAVDMLVVLGGPMSVHDTDRHAWLGSEKAYLSDAMAVGKRVLGICLGGQLVAEALGAKVVRNGEPEVGWHPVRLTPAGLRARAFGALPEEFDAFHWHGETFGVPFGAVKSASSEACADQAFEAAGGRVVALQFHLESTPVSVRALIENCPDDLAEAPYVHAAEEMLADPARFDRANRLADLVLDALADA